MAAEIVKKSVLDDVAEQVWNPDGGIYGDRPFDDCFGDFAELYKKARADWQERAPHSVSDMVVNMLWSPSSAHQILGEQMSDFYTMLGLTYIRFFAQRYVADDDKRNLPFSKVVRDASEAMGKGPTYLGPLDLNWIKVVMTDRS